MQLTVRDVSKLLNLSERTIYRYIQQNQIPAYKIIDQYRFNRAEILEWATAQKITVSPDLFNDSDEGPQELPNLLEALKTGGVHYGLKGDTKETLLQNVVHTMSFPAGVDRGFILKVLLAREALSSTGIGEGIAIPHVRNPIVLNVPQSVIALFFLEKPVDFGAIDGKPVHCLFTLVSPTVRTHLHLLSRLAFSLKDGAFKQRILEQAAQEALFQEIGRIEGRIR
ncbi:MAG: PTS sugar transporter subunit IIA [Fibrobacterota bacterium]